MKKNILRSALAVTLVSFMVESIFVLPAFAAAAYTATPENINNSRSINGRSVTDSANISAELNQTQKLSFVNSANIAVSAPVVPGNGNNDLALLLDTSDNTVPTPPPTDLSHFAIFTGDSTGDLTVKGTNVKINGDIHSNGGISFMASSLNIKGTCETVKDKPFGLNTTNYTWLGVANINNAGGYTKSDLQFNFKVPSINIPDIDQDIRSQAGNNLIEIQDYDSKLDTFWNNTKNQLVASGGNPFQVPVQKQPLWLAHNTYPSPNGVVKFAFTGTSPLVMDSDKTYFFDGDVAFTTGLIIKANVKIVATGTILISGGVLDTTGGSALIYSVNNDVICIPTKVSVFNGKFYAPHGAVKFTADDVVINGNIIAKYINDIPGNTTINCPASGSSGSNGTTITKTSHLEKVKQAAVSFITALQNRAEPNKKLGIILYNSNAYPLDSTDGYKLYSLNSPSDYSSLITKINGISSSNTTNSNMGDGIRKSLNLLSGLGTDLSRNIVTLTASTPNTYTVDSTGNPYTSLSGNVGDPGVSTKTDNTAAPLDYAKQWLYSMNTARAGSSFINCLDSTFTDFASVDVSTEAVGNAYSSTGQGISGASFHYIGASAPNLSAILSSSLVQQPPPAPAPLPPTIKVDATFTLVLPAVGSDKCFKVKPVLPVSTAYTVDSTSGDTTLTAEFTNVELQQTTSGSGIYVIEPDSIQIPDINLQYVSTGKQIPMDQPAYSEDIPFNESDNNMQLTFKDPDLVSVPPVTVNYPAFNVKVGFVRDIN